jgi:DNA polymerase III epsilon subunit-like protein
MNFRKIIFDTETTGIDADKKAVEIAMIEVDDDLNILGEANSLINPGIPIPPHVSEIHGITDEMVKDAPTIEQWVETHFGAEGLVGDVALIGHRVDFDLPLFAPIGKAVATLDTLIFSYVYVPEAPNKKLDTLKEFLGLPGGGISHRAAADTLTCLQLLQHITKVSGRSLQTLIEVERIVLHDMIWGKYEGTPLVQVPRKYREWLLTLAGLDRHLRYSLEQVVLLDPPREVLSKLPPGSMRRIFIPRRNNG